MVTGNFIMVNDSFITVNGNFIRKLNMAKVSPLRHFLSELLTNFLQKHGYEVLTYTSNIGDKYFYVTSSNGKSHCFVINCIKQSIYRIPAQIDALAISFDSVTVFTLKGIQSLVENKIPEEVGLIVVDKNDWSNIIVIKTLLRNLHVH